MEEAAELANHLPLSFKSPKEQEYIEFLWDAFETNCTHGKYQFAFRAYHMLTMSFIYFNIWQIRQTKPEDFAKGLIFAGAARGARQRILERRCERRGITTGCSGRPTSRRMNEENHDCLRRGGRLYYD